MNDLPEDYEQCGDCGYDHDYEYPAAHQWHTEHPCSYCHYTEEKGHETYCPTQN